MIDTSWYQWYINDVSILFYTILLYLDGVINKPVFFRGRAGRHFGATRQDVELFQMAGEALTSKVHQVLWVSPGPGVRLG